MALIRTKKKLTRRKACAFAKEEAESSKTYSRYGFPQMAADEARHSRNFKKICKGVKA